MANQRGVAAGAVGIRSAAKRAGLTLEQLSDDAGFSRKTFGRRLKDPSGLTLGELVRLELATGVPWDDIATGQVTEP